MTRTRACPVLFLGVIDKRCGFCQRETGRTGRAPVRPVLVLVGLRLGQASRLLTTAMLIPNITSTNAAK